MFSWLSSLFQSDILSEYQGKLKVIFANIIVKKLRFNDLESLRQVNKYFCEIVINYYENSIQFKKIVKTSDVTNTNCVNLEIGIYIKKMDISEKVKKLTLYDTYCKIGDNNVIDLTINYLERPLLNFQSVEILKINNQTINVSSTINSMKNLKKISTHNVSSKQIPNTIVDLCFYNQEKKLDFTGFINLKNIEIKSFYELIIIPKNNIIEKFCGFYYNNDIFNLLNENLKILHITFTENAYVNFKKLTNLSKLKVCIDTEKVVTIDLTKNIKIEKLIVELRIRKPPYQYNNILTGPDNNIKKLKIKSINKPNNVEYLPNFVNSLVSELNLTKLKIRHIHNDQEYFVDLTNKKIKLLKIKGANLTFSENIVESLTFDSIIKNNIYMDFSMFKNLRKIKFKSNLICEGLKINLEKNKTLKYIDICCGSTNVDVVFPESNDNLQKMRLLYGCPKDTNKIHLNTYKNLRKVFLLRRMYKYSNINENFFIIKDDDAPKFAIKKFKDLL